MKKLEKKEKNKKKKKVEKERKKKKYQEKKKIKNKSCMKFVLLFGSSRNRRKRRIPLESMETRNANLPRKFKFKPSFSYVFH